MTIDERLEALAMTQANLVQAQAGLVNNQAAFQAGLTSLINNQAAFQANFLALQSRIDAQFERIDAQFAEIRDILDGLPEAVRRRIGFEGQERTGE
jgi:hypothetical protein